MPEIWNNTCLVFIVIYTNFIVEIQVQISAFQFTSWLSLSKLYNLTEPFYS